MDLSKNLNLATLYCGDNLLASIDVTSNESLDLLWCYNNQLNELNVSTNSALTLLSCGSNLLDNLDISNNTALVYLEAKKMPTLTEICVWMLPFPPERVGELERKSGTAQASISQQIAANNKIPTEHNRGSLWVAT